MTKLIKNSLYVLVFLTSIIVTNYFSFKAGQDIVEYKANRFTHIIVGSGYFLDILENIDNKEKIQEITELALIDKLFQGLSAYKLEAMPITEHQAMQAKNLIHRVKLLLEQKKIHLFEKRNSNQIVSYVADNIDAFSNDK